MRVFVAGATGAIGRRLVPLLVARGHEVTGTTRSEAKARLLLDLGATPAIVDGLDGAAVGEAVARARPDAIVHQMTAIAGAPDFRHFDRWFAATNALRTTGTEHLLAAARAAGVERFVAQSYTGWTIARNRSGLATEDEPLGADPPRAQRETLAAIRSLERAVLTQAPLHGIVLRYGGFYGREELEPMAELVRRRRLPVIGGGAGVSSWIHLEDAAAATVTALERGPRGVFNIVDDDPAPAREWIAELARIVGAKPPRYIPAWLGRLAAGEVAVRWMTEGRGASNAKAARELGWEPEWRSWRDGFRAVLADPGPASPTSPTSPTTPIAA